MTPGRSPHGLDGFAVTAWFSHDDRRIHCRGRLIIAEGVVTFSPFEPADGVEEISRPGGSVIIERGWAPWSAWRLELTGRVSATVALPRGSQRHIRDALSAAGVQSQN
jgi:hypothetical protein